MHWRGVPEMRSPFDLLRRRTVDMSNAIESEAVLEPEPAPEQIPAADLAPSSTKPIRPPLDQYRGKGGLGRLPQCPECGRFRLQMERNESAFTFDCVDCRAHWSWSIHEPWPRTTARPDLPNEPIQDPTEQTSENQEK